MRVITCISEFCLGVFPVLCLNHLYTIVGLAYQPPCRVRTTALEKPLATNVFVHKHPGVPVCGAARKQEVTLQYDWGGRQERLIIMWGTRLLHLNKGLIVVPLRTLTLTLYVCVILPARYLQKHEWFYC